MSKNWTPVPSLAGCTDDVKVERMVKWFFENYEDPAERTPFESAEGGYQFIWGVADANDVLQEAFDAGVAIDGDPVVIRAGVPDELIERAVAEIENDGWDWVPVPHESDYE